MVSNYHTLLDADTIEIANPSVAELYEDALVYETGSAITSTGALTAFSGAKTGRSPLDKRIVREPGSENEVWWGPVNKPMTPQVSPARLVLSCSVFCPEPSDLHVPVPDGCWLGGGGGVAWAGAGKGRPRMAA